MATYKTWNDHYLRVYNPALPRPDGREGQLWADSTGIGPDESFEVVTIDNERFGGFEVVVGERIRGSGVCHASPHA